MNCYSVVFKPASLKQIFMREARDYRNNCISDLKDTIHSEQPKDLVAGIWKRREAFIMSKVDLSDTLRQKITALPFVEKVLNEDELKIDLQQRKTFKDKIVYSSQKLIY
jgi:hypothetical protein